MSGRERAILKKTAEGLSIPQQTAESGNNSMNTTGYGNLQEDAHVIILVDLYVIFLVFRQI